MIVSIFAGMGLVVALKERYWLLLPLLMTMDISIPRLPFSGSELGAIIVVATHFLRLGLKAEAPARYDVDLLIVLPVFFWMMLVFCLNPVGLAMFGSETIGGRFYFRIVLGLFTLFSLSALRVDEAGAKILFYVLFCGMIYVLLRGVMFPRVDPDDAILLGDAAEASTRYGFVICMSLFYLLFSRYSLAEILKSVPLMTVFALLFLLTVYSGKRRAFGALVIVPFLRAFLTGKQKALTVLLSVMALFVALIAIAGDGTIYRLPLSARRALSVIAPQYETASAGGIHDYFREKMREQARFIIHENPWFGRKGFAMSYDETAWMNFGGSKTDIFVGHAYAGNWHSTWYAFAADFGIPCMILWAIYTLYLIRFTRVACRTVTTGVWLPTCCLYLSLSLMNEIVFSYTTGHSANTSYFMWVNQGLLLAVVRGYREAHPVSLS